MNEIYRTAMELQKQRELEATLNEAAAEQKRKDEEQKYIDRYDMMNAIRIKRESFDDYKTNVKRALLTEALKRIYVGSIKGPTPDEIAIGEALVGQYVAERDVSEMIHNFSNTSLLENLGKLINKHYKIMTEDADMDNPDSMVITKDNLDDFYEELDDTEDMEDITNTIRLRVSNAEEEFVNKIEADKQNLKTIMQDTADRVQSSKEGLDNDYEEEPVEDIPEEIRQEAVMDAKRKVYALQSRHQTVFERMAKKLSESVMVDTDMREQFLGENGRLDMFKVIESTRCMYTLLEMVATLKIERVDEKYIEESINSI